MELKNIAKIENKWQKYWEKNKTYSPDIKRTASKFYNLWMFPYPSAEGLHAGHGFSSTGSDISGRYKRMQGFDVFQPIGYDSFGIHSENFAIKIGEHPQNVITRTTKNYERQMRSLGHGYDWTRTVTTSDVSYYKWTQWLFTELFKAGLAYRREAQVNWCPSCKTVLADEQVIDGKCERCQSEVEKRDLEQWFFRQTAYAERLLKGHKDINWTEKIKTAQKNWIGKKIGISISYPIKDSKHTLICWTSRPDTNFGATFIALSPNHPLVMNITTSDNKESVEKYIKQYRLRRNKAVNDDSERQKTGVFTGACAVNRLNYKPLPIWISDYVLDTVGTGAVVGVPGHDKRDFEFAQTYGIKVLRVVAGTQGDTSPIKSIDQVQEEQGKMVNSEFLNGMDIRKATGAMMDYLEEKGWGKRETTYHLRDWLISRQRYWGPPIPMVYCEKCHKAGRGWIEENKKTILYKDQSDWDHAGWYPEDKLPVELPYIDDYKPKGGNTSPLADHPEFYKTICPFCGSQARRETDVSDTFLDSSWYFLRYPSVDVESSTTKPFDTDITKKWLPVDLYFGGAEHAVLHLMYARFVTMVLHDLGHIEFSEPFTKFYAHGLMIKDGAKMSKSKGNVVNPDTYIEKFGADTFRLYQMFIGPMDGSPDFRDTGIEGMRRFVNRMIHLLEQYSEMPDLDDKDKKILLTKMHQTIKKVTNHMEKFQYNTAIASIMEYANILDKRSSKEALETLCLLLAPFAPHLMEEVWQEVMGNKTSVHQESWPNFESKYIEEHQVTIIVQINGKIRDQIVIEASEGEDQDKVYSLAIESEKLQNMIKNREIRKVVFVPKKVINLVI